METADEYLMQSHIERHQLYHFKCEYFQALNGSKLNTFRLQTRQQTPNWWETSNLCLLVSVYCILRQSMSSQGCTVEPDPWSTGQQLDAQMGQDDTPQRDPAGAFWTDTVNGGHVYSHRHLRVDSSFNLFHQCLCCTFPGFQFCFFSSDCFYSFALTHTHHSIAAV